MKERRNYLADQWLRLSTFTSVAQVWSLVGELRSPRGQKNIERGMELQLALKFPLMFDVGKCEHEISEYKAKVSIEYFLFRCTLFWVPVLEVCSLPPTQLSV